MPVKYKVLPAGVMLPLGSVGRYTREGKEKCMAACMKEYGHKPKQFFTNYGSREQNYVLMQETVAIYWSDDPEFNEWGEVAP